MNLLFVFYAAYAWFIGALKLTSLPKLYYRLSSNRGIDIKELRTFEKTGIKLARRQLDVHYLDYCYTLGLCPQKFKFKLPKDEAYRNTQEFYDIALKRQIDKAKLEESHEKQNFCELKSALFSKLTMFEKTCLMKLLTSHIKKVTEKVIFNHSRKLQSLWRRQRNSAPDCIINLSDKKLTLEEEEAIRYGLEHHILPSKINIDQIRSNIEKATYTAKKRSGLQANQDFRHRIIHTVHSFANAARNICGARRNREKHCVLKKLAADGNIVYCKYDKGSGVCIMNSTDYFLKLDSIVMNRSKFKTVYIPKDPCKHPVVKKYDQIKRYVSKYLTNDYYSEDIVNKLSIPGTGPGKLYGMAKVHKTDTPVRPVCSMINTPEYELAKFLDNLIKPYIPNQYMLFSTKQFLDKLKDFSILPGDKMVSFDVVSLFTNVPLIETINLVANYIYARNDPPHFSKTVFKNMMKIATQGYFLHKNILYQQIDGVIMGSPLGPTLANFFLA